MEILCPSHSRLQKENKMAAKNQTLREFIPKSEKIILECEGYMRAGFNYTEYTFAVTENAIWMASDENETNSDLVKASAITGMSRNITDNGYYYIVSIRACGDEVIHTYFDDEEIAKDFYKAIAETSYSSASRGKC